MNDERDEPRVIGQTAGILAMMSAMVKSLPPSTRKRLLRQIPAEFESLLTAMSTTGGTEAQAEREGVEWMRDYFLKQIAGADSKPKSRKPSKNAEEVSQPAAIDKDPPSHESPSSPDVDFEL